MACTRTHRRGTGIYTGFTLVELLVVIGIIGLLVAILLPALASARRQAMLIKCASNMRQCYTALHLYADAYKGYAIPARAGGGIIQNGATPSTDASGYNPVPYNLYGYWYGIPTGNLGDAQYSPNDTNSACWWMEFLARYLGSARGGQGDDKGSGVSSALAHATARSSVFWCPAWTASIADNDGQPLYTGYAMNYMVSITSGHPRSPFGASGQDFVVGTTPVTLNSSEWFNVKLDYQIAGAYDPTQGKWYRLSQISNPAQRCMLADARSLFLECWQSPNVSQPAGSNFVPPPQNVIAGIGGTGGAYTGGGSTGQNSFDCYRHGAYPGVISSWTGNGRTITGACYSPQGGKVSYNILYYDGHVATSVDRGDAYRSIRMRYPN